MCEIPSDNWEVPIVVVVLKKGDIYLLPLIVLHGSFCPNSSSSDPTEGCFNYPLVEKFLTTKRFSRVLLFYYLLCRGLTLITLLCACVYLGYYLRLASVTDEFGCTLRVGLLASDPDVPDKVQCKLIAVGVFSLLRYMSVCAVHPLFMIENDRDASDM